MKQIIKLVLTSFALLSLASCTVDADSSKESSKETVYTVTFLNYDETLLDSIEVKEGEQAIYSGATPTKAEDDEFTYEFEGWDKDLTSITADVTTTATYKAVAKENWGPIIWF